MTGNIASSKNPFNQYFPQIDPNLSFVLMPFQPDMNEIYQDVVKPLVTEDPIKMKCLRADEIFSANEIMQDIWEKVLSARVIIADLTYRNPNVLYELGISHALGKRAILLTQDLQDVPFDLRYIRCIVYDRGTRGVEKLKHNLKETILSLLSEPIIDAYRITSELEEAQKLRIENQQLHHEISRLENIKFLRGRDDLEPLEQLASDAEDILVAGPTLAIVAMKQQFFYKRIGDGCNIRFIIPDPDPNSMAMQGIMGHWHTSSEGFISEVQSALVNFHLLKQSIPDTAEGSLEVRFVEFALTLSLLIIDGGTDRGYLQIELLPFNTASPDRPHFVLHASHDIPWYSFFREQYEQLWKNHAKHLDID